MASPVIKFFFTFNGFFRLMFVLSETFVVDIRWHTVISVHTLRVLGNLRSHWVVFNCVFMPTLLHVVCTHIHIRMINMCGKKISLCCTYICSGRTHAFSLVNFPYPNICQMLGWRLWVVWVKLSLLYLPWEKVKVFVNEYILYLQFYYKCHNKRYQWSFFFGYETGISRKYRARKTHQA